MIRTRFLPIGLALAFAAATPVAALAASSDQPGKHDTAKGAAAGALVGHEVGHGHALVGAGVGAAIGHHEKKKAESSSNG